MSCTGYNNRLFRHKSWWKELWSYDDLECLDGIAYFSTCPPDRTSMVPALPLTFSWRIHTAWCHGTGTNHRQKRQICKPLLRSGIALAKGFARSVDKDAYIPWHGYPECINGRSAQMDRSCAVFTLYNSNFDVAYLGTARFLPVCLSGCYFHLTVQSAWAGHSSQPGPGSLPEL